MTTRTVPPAALEADHLRSVRRLTRAVCRGQAPEELFALAIESLLESTEADRASMLLFDPDGVMRFKAWHGLPDDYRAAVEGHTPWSPDVVDPEPILVGDVSKDPASAPYLETFRAYDMAALAFVPLYCGRLLGKFMLYYRAPHRFLEAEVELASVVADHVAFAVQRSRIEARMQAANDDLDSILRHVGEGITVQDAAGRLLYANDAAVRVMQRPDREALMHSTNADLLADLEIFDASGAPFPVDRLPGRRAMQSGKTERALMQFRTRATGETRWSAVTSSAAPGPDGEARFAVNVFRDVTEIREAHQRLEENRRQLEAALSVAREAEQRKDEFLAVLGHELRNPLAPIVTALRLMDMKDAGADDRIFAHERQLIERQVAHLRRLIDDLLDVSRITRGKIELDRRPVELQEIVTAAVELVGPLLEERGHTLRVDVPREGLVVWVDRVRMTQVIENLLSNAARYTDPGGSIEVVGHGDGHDAVLTVQDNGMGIPADVLPGIFDQFVQGPRTLDRARGGLGLGLTIVRRLTDLHDGTVQATSEGPGTGAAFVLRLPRLDVTADEAMVPGAFAPSAGASLRVLVVDDNVDAADTLTEVLSMLGHHVSTAHDGPSALALAGRVGFDVAVLDLGLPVMDGFELAHHLKELQPDVRLVALTGYGQANDRERTREAGFALHLVKPVDLDELIAAVSG